MKITAVSGALETDASNNLYYTPGTATRGIVPLGTAANTLLFTTTGATNVTLPTSWNFIKWFNWIARHWRNHRCNFSSTGIY